jgi:hypothetical protein
MRGRRQLLSPTTLGKFQRLELIAPELSRRLEHATAMQLREIRAVVCRAVVQHVGLEESVADEALDSLNYSESAPETLCKAVASRAEQLDMEYFTLGKAADEGRASEDEVHKAFCRARAVSALALAISGIDADTVREAIYEAAAATDDVTKLEKLADAAFIKPTAR